MTKTNKTLFLNRRGSLIVALFATILVTAADQASDKSKYHLFHPTPDRLLRDLSTDRPDLTESPYTVDAGHFQIETDFVNDNLIVIYDYPAPIRKVIYTTNAIESLNSVIRKSTRNRKVFPDDQSAMKVVYLAMQEATKKWTMPIRDWKPALNRFTIEFGERVTAHL